MFKKQLYASLMMGMLMFSACKKETNPAPAVVNTSETETQTKSPGICTEMYADDHELMKTEAALMKYRMWANGQTIRVKFMNGDSYLQSKVIQYSSQWLQYVNLKLQFVQPEEAADVRVAFNWNGDPGSWAYVGTDCKYIPEDMPTMNYGWLNQNTSEAEFSRVILHEFGHVLGLIHEHQSPSATIPWDTEKVYQYYQTTQGWGPETVDANIFFRYDRSQTNFSNFDSKSIMLYAVPSTLTTNGFSTSTNYRLSDVDIYFTGQMYPYPGASRHILFKGQRLYPGQFLLSKDGRFKFLMQSDGNFVLYKNGTQAIWSSKSWGKPVNYCELKTDGNMTLMDNNRVVYWQSYTKAFPGGFLVLQDDANAVIYQNGVKRWGTNTTAHK